MTTVLRLTVRDLASAEAVAAAAERAGVAAIRLADAGAIDPTVVAAYLAGRYPGVSYIPEVPTTHQAPYNVARRVLSLDRATGGRIGLALLAGDGDEVTDASAVAGVPPDPIARWAEYALVLTRLWESFPRTALIGDQEAGVVADDALIRPIGHEGAYYRVAGPLDGPSSVQGRPILVADLGLLDATAAAAAADIVVVEPGRATEAHTALTEALTAAGRHRDDVVLLGRVRAGDRIPLDEHGLDGVELEGDAAELIAALSAPTLRSVLGLPVPAVAR
ncbi:LLM class flavin-dependent oxidoreductase [Paractinoplanes lichenicola]|uniref:LLM class flavin-dependent oxidoreductase n=1 Tax=Paractinoplanes lichenicola TaxID=2802976 RepID=A0ABS1VEQ7_9ACTN|nr:LLM class flavin-dependent oxidoreductase [Actinoplanes lichenicola]MBL7253158.1 LLM class flavin-dependent oxidoreductase [Actinoplanes lichenicola]